MRPRRTLTVAGLALAILAAATSANAACPPGGLQATLKFQNPPANATFAQGTPVNLVLQIENCSGGNVVTTEQFSSSEFYRFLRFSGPQGGVVNTNAASSTGLVTVHNVNKTYFCQSRNQVTQSPTAIPVVPIETLPASFFREYVMDAASFYDLSKRGFYRVQFDASVLTFDPSALITDCDQFQGPPPVTVANLTATSGRHPLRLLTNTLQFKIAAGALDHIVIRPAVSAIAAGGTEFYTAEGFDAANVSLGDITSTTTFSITNGTCAGGAPACTATSTGNHIVTGTSQGKSGTATLTVADPAATVKVWVGLANSDDVGTRFDLKAIIRKDNSDFGAGQLGSVFGGSSNFTNASFFSIPIFSPSGPLTTVSPPLSVQVLARIACVKGGQLSAQARLWFNGAKIDSGTRRDAGSRLEDVNEAPLFLRSGFALNGIAGTARTSIAVQAGSPCGAYQSFGVWSTP